MSIHIVTHCWAVDLPQFAKFLQYQLSSLVLYPPEVEHLIEVRYCPDDRATADVVNFFAIELGSRIGLSPMQPPERLFRRAIGRNEAALSSHTELVWHTDCDYLFGPGCLDGLWRSWNGLTEFASMVYPMQILTMASHADGDLVAENGMIRVANIPFDLFIPQRVKKAFGGLQIVPGSLARRYGYLDGHKKYQQPLSKPFENFHDDVAYRKRMLEIGPILPVDVPNLYRLRHTKSTYAGAPENIYGKVPA